MDTITTAPLAGVAAACAPVMDNAATLLDHLVGGRWDAAAALARDTALACGAGALAAVQGLLPVLGF